MRSIIQGDEDFCFYCGSSYIEKHHVIGKSHSNRVFCDEDGLYVMVCRNCHDKIHNGEGSKDMRTKLIKLGQLKWEAYYGPGIEFCGRSPREEFMKRYGKNYL